MDEGVPSLTWDSPGKNTGVGCHFLLQGIFPTQGSNLLSCVPCMAGRFFTTVPPEKPWYYLISPIWDFPGGSEGKASACNAGDPGLIPGLGRSPGEGNGNPIQYSCLENPMDRGAW